MAMLPGPVPDGQGPIPEIRPRLAGSPSRRLAERSDEGLVTDARQGDEGAFATLYARHAPAILRYCRSLLRSAQEAEDVSQEVFVLAISALRRGTEPVAFRPWLYTVAHNACMSHLRTRRPVLVADHGVLVGPAAAAEPGDGHREELRQLLDDIGSLPDVQRGALLLSQVDGFSYEEVGAALGVPLPTVRASIFRARRTLQRLAEARDADCEAIRSELSRLADRRGRRGRHITSHLDVCGACRDYREKLKKGRPRIARGAVPRAHALSPVGALVALKAKIAGATTAGGVGAAATTATGGIGVAKLAAVAASTCALVAGVGADGARLHARPAPPSASRLVSLSPAPRLLARTRTRARAAPLSGRDGTGPVSRRRAGTGNGPAGRWPRRTDVAATAPLAASAASPASPAAAPAPLIGGEDLRGGRAAVEAVAPAANDHGSHGADHRRGTPGDRDHEGDEAGRPADAPVDEDRHGRPGSGRGSSGPGGGASGSTGSGSGSTGSGSGSGSTSPRADDESSTGDADVPPGAPAPDETQAPGAPGTPDGSAMRNRPGDGDTAADPTVDTGLDTPNSGQTDGGASAPGGHGPSGSAAPGPDHPVAPAAERSADAANGASAPPNSTGAAPQRR